ncbi:MAG: hypothetical protein ABW068_03715 [Candidatus Thiodiazotropha sp.]
MTIIKPPPQEPEYLQRFLSFCHRRRYPKNTEIIHIGDPQASLRSHERFWDIQVHQNRFDL